MLSKIRSDKITVDSIASILGSGLFMFDKEVFWIVIVEIKDIINSF